MDSTGAIKYEAMRSQLYEAAQVLLTRSAKWSSLRAWGLQIAKRRRRWKESLRHPQMA
jgi:hypothetical protein